MRSRIPKRDLPIMIIFGVIVIIVLLSAVIVHWGDKDFFPEFITNLSTDLIGAFIVYLLLDITLRR